MTKTVFLEGEDTQQKHAEELINVFIGKYTKTLLQKNIPLVAAARPFFSKPVSYIILKIFLVRHLHLFLFLSALLSFSS